jgi:hypothetical protein
LFYNKTIIISFINNNKYMINFSIEVKNFTDASHLKVSLQVKGYKTGMQEKIADACQKIFSDLPKMIESDGKSINKKDLQSIKFEFTKGKDVKVILRLKDKAIALESLKNKDGQEFDLSHISSIKDLSDSIFKLDKSQPPPLSAFIQEEPFYKKILHFLAKLFTFEIFFGSKIDSIIYQNIKHYPLDKLEDLYVNADALLVEIDGSLSQARDYNYFTAEQKDEYIHAALAAAINERLKQHPNETPWDSKKIQHLDLVRLMRAASSDEKKLNQVIDKLNLISPVDVPLEELSKIPLSENNKEALTQAWKQLLGNLFAKGHLDKILESSNRKDFLMQIKYATCYLEALNTLPSPLKKKLAPFLENLDAMQNPKDIKDFLIQRSRLLDKMAIPLDDSQLHFNRRIYFDHIAKKFQGIIRKCVSGSEAGQLAKVLASGYVQEESGRNAISFYMKNIQKEILDTLSKEDAELAKSLLDPKNLEKLFFNELERIAVFDYHFSAGQMEQLQHALTQKENLANWTKKISELPELYSENFDTSYKNLLNEGMPPQALLNSTIGKHSHVWINLLKHIVEKQELNQISNQTVFDKTAINQLKIYIDARRALHQAQMDKALEREIEGIEQNFPQVIKDYMNVESQMNLDQEIDSLLFSDKVIEDVRNEIDDSFKFLTPEQQADLMTITYAYKRVIAKPPRLLTAEESKEVQRIIHKYKSDKAFKKVLKALEAGDKGHQIFLKFFPSFTHGLIDKFAGDELGVKAKLPKGITEDALSFLTAVMSKIEKTEKFMPPLDKGKKLWELYQKDPSNPSISEKDKLTLSEMGLINELARFHSQLEKLQKMGVVEIDEKLKQLFEKSAEAKELLKNIENTILPHLKDHYVDGSILAYNGTKKQKWTGKRLEPEAYMTSVIADFGLTHGAKIFKEVQEKEGIIETKVKVSEVMGSWGTDDLSLYQLLISNIWELDVSKLFNKNMQTTLESVYGKNWKKQVNQKYQQIERELHSNFEKRVQKIKNSNARRMEAGLARYPKLTNFFLPMKIEGHKRAFIRDFNKIHDKFFEGNSIDETQICSEFVTKANIAALVELNRQLTQDILHHYKGNKSLAPQDILQNLTNKKVVIPPPVKDYLNGTRLYKEREKETMAAEKELKSLLKSQGYSPEEVELAIRVGNQEIFTLPYDKKERLKAVDPGRMVKLLVDAGCVKKKKLPRPVTTFFQVKE